MSLLLNEEQRMLQQSAQSLIVEHAPISELRRLRDDPKSGPWYSEELWEKMVEQGWSAILIPEEFGGLDFGFSGLALILQECGRQLSASPLLQNIGVCVPVLLCIADKRQKKEYLPPVASGEHCLALAIEEGRHHNPAGTALEAQKKSSGWVLSGRKVFVADGMSADRLLVVGRNSGTAGDREGLSLFLVEGDAQGLLRKHTVMIDSRDAACLQFTDVQAVLLGEEGMAWQVLDRALDFARSALAAEMLGGALEVFERTLAYLKEREQFGAKIGSFQALQHRAAHLFVELELSRSALLHALGAADIAMRTQGEQEWNKFALAASAAKYRANEVFLSAAGEAIQMHGGIGMTDELDIGFYLKRAQISAQMYGNSSFLLRRHAEFSGF